MSVRVRFAPSPTGALHVGGARTALFNFLFAKKNKGTFILRIEDTDQQRNKESSLREQMIALEWLGLFWDEGPITDDLSQWKGDFGPYRQSQRQDIYKKYATQLLKMNKAYYCFLTDDQIVKLKSKDQRIKSPYRDWSLDQALKKKQNGDPAVIRFKNSTNKKHYTIEDIVRKNISFPSDMVGDFILLRSNDMPVYNFSCAVDDALMKITHVLRAEEHLANTLRQLMIAEALDFPPPYFGHLSLILDSEKKKLSKRSGALSCLEYKEKGYLPSALNNFLALLGWNPKDNREFFNLKELIENFSETNLNPAGAVFDQDKLKWINAHHIRSLPYDQLWNVLKPMLEKNNINLPEEREWREQAISSLKSSFSNLNEAFEIFSLFSKNHYKIDETAKEIKKWDSSRAVLEIWKTFLDQKDELYLSLEDFKNIVNNIKTKLNVKGRFLFMPLRVAMIGQSQGLELQSIIPLIERKELLKRAQTALDQLF